MTDVAFHLTHRKEYQSKLVVVLSKGSRCNFWGDRHDELAALDDTFMISMSFNSYATQAIFFIIPALSLNMKLYTLHECQLCLTFITLYKLAI